ncbi:MAG: hypothetical protein ACRERR_03520 [Moraxellaceae bacterium]
MSLLNAWRFIAVSFLAIWLVACGSGGGDSGDSGSGSSFSVSFDTASLSFSYREGETPSAQLVTATAHGTAPSSGVYIGAVVSGAGINQPIYVSVDEAAGKAYASIMPMYGLSPGSYSGSIKLMACTDESCGKHFPGSPHTLNYSISIQAQLKASPASLSFTAAEGQAGATQSVAITLPSNTAAAQLQVNYGAGASGWLQIQNNGSSLLVTTQAAGLAAGNYSASVVLTGDGGQQQITVPVSFDVTYSPQQHLSIDKASVSFAGAEGSILPSESVAIDLPPGSSSFSTSLAYVAGGSGWLQVQKNGSNIVLTASTVGLGVGSYSANLTVRDSTTNEVVVVPVGLTVAYDALQHLRIDQSSLAFTGVETQSLTAKTLGVGLPPAASGIATSISYGAGATNWLHVQKSGNDLIISVNAGGLAPATYAANLTVQASGTAESLVVPIGLSISKGLIGLSAESVVIDQDAAGVGSFSIQAASGVTTSQWSASSNKSWLVLNSASGAIGGQLNWHIDPAGFEGLANDADHKAVITIAGTGLSSVTKEITFKKKLKEIAQIDDLALLSGDTGEVLLYGAGFAGLSNFADRLQISGGLTAYDVTVLSDTMAVVTLQSVPAGNYSIGLGTTLGIATHENVLRVLSREDYSYQAINTAGRKGALVWNPVNKTAYAADLELDRVHQFVWNGAIFENKVVALSKPRKVGFSRDHGSLLVMSENGDVRELEPNTLVQKSFKATGLNPLPDNSQNPLVVDGRNRIWVGTSRYDLATKEIKTSMWYDSSARAMAAVSRDGSRMLFGSDGSFSPIPPGVRLDLIDDVMVKLPDAEITRYFGGYSTDHKGKRWLLGNYGMYDQDMLLLGRFEGLPSRWVATRSVLSRDGSRAYFYAFVEGAININPGNPDSTSADKGRIYVYNTGPLSASQSRFPLMGYFEVQDYAGCRNFYAECAPLPMMDISHDDRTLFLASDRKFIVVPVPAQYQSAAAPSSASAPMGVSARKLPREKAPMRMRRWFP